MEVQWEGGHAHPDQIEEIPEIIADIPEEEKAEGRLDDLQIHAEKDGTITVDMYPNKMVEVIEEGTPTKKNPDIKVDIAKFKKKDPESGEVKEVLSPAQVVYTNNYPVEQVLDAIPQLFEKKYRCPLCEARQREILGKVEKIVSSDLSTDEKKEALEALVTKLEARVQALEAEPAPLVPAPAPAQPAGPILPGLPGFPQPDPAHHPLGAKYDYLFDGYNEMLTRFMDARNSIEAMGRSVFEMPMRLIRTVFPPPMELFEKLQAQRQQF
jgi:hypothetical protein